MQERKARLTHLPIHLTQKEPGIYLLIIGESLVRDHMSAYGYPHNTTPFLATQSTEPGTLIFKNAYSNYVQTVPALSLALTERNQYREMLTEDAFSFVNAFSFVEIAKAAGYKTYWISNQMRWGKHDTPNTAIAMSADEYHSINQRSANGFGRAYYDEKLLDSLPQIPGNTHALVVVHLMGCHFNYDARHPKRYHIETGSDPVVNSYDSAVLYNDDVIRRITEYFSNYKNFKGWIYFSDHGEDLDTHAMHTPTNFTWQMTHIPLIMYFTPDFISENPQIFETLAAHQDRYWTNDLLYNLMLTVLGIEGAPNPEPHLDLASPAYDRTRENVLTLHGKKHISAEP